MPTGRLYILPDFCVLDISLLQFVMKTSNIPQHISSENRLEIDSINLSNYCNKVPHLSRDDSSEESSSKAT